MHGLIGDQTSSYQSEEEEKAIFSAANLLIKWKWSHTIICQGNPASSHACCDSVQKSLFIRLRRLVAYMPRLLLERKLSIAYHGKAKKIDNITQSH